MSTVWIIKECHVDGIRRHAGAVVDVAPDVAVRLVANGYASFIAPERAVVPPAPERAVALPQQSEPARRPRGGRR